uniref:Uncharacterized protein n=1 Tax=Arundo donax TaxID=35708 RepID=A0A0A9AV70_ARUDO
MNARPPQTNHSL